MTSDKKSLRGNPNPDSPPSGWGEPKTGAPGSPMTASPDSPPPSSVGKGGEFCLPWVAKKAASTYEYGGVLGGGEKGGESVGNEPPNHLTPHFLGVSIDTQKWGEGGLGTSDGAPEQASEPFEIELPWPSRTGNRAVRHGGGGHYLSPEAVAYRKAVRRHLAARRLADRGWGGPYALEWVLSPPDRAQRDFDNVMKVVADALVWAGLLADDSNAVIRRGSWEWTEPESPGRILVVGKVV